jgi:hypothetical protein
MLPAITVEEVKSKRYKNSDKIPAVGDMVYFDNYKTSYVRVGVLGSTSAMFVNCSFDDILHLTNPELVYLQIRE